MSGIVWEKGYFLYLKVKRQHSNSLFKPVSPNSKPIPLQIPNGPRGGVITPSYSYSQHRKPPLVGSTLSWEVTLWGLSVYVNNRLLGAPLNIISMFSLVIGGFEIVYVNIV